MSGKLAASCAVLASALLCGCAGGTPSTSVVSTTATSAQSSADAQPATPSLPVTTDSSTPVTTGSAEPTGMSSAEATATTTSTAAGSDVDPSGSQTPLVLDDERAGKELGKGDFPFMDGQWSDGVFSVNGAQVTGIATTLTSCSDYSPASVQLRLGKRFRKLTFTVGQGDSGKSMKDRVLVKTEANGRPLPPKSVTFTNPADFTVDTTNVNGVQIFFSLDPEAQDCGSHGDVQAVVYKVVATK